MWLCFNKGFFSVVQSTDPEQSGKLCVRARVRSHLEDAFPKHEIFDTPRRDYPCRVFISGEELSTFLLKQSASIDYDNFKNSVKDRALHDAYTDIWGVMYEYGVDSELKDKSINRFKNAPQSHNWKSWPTGPKVIVRGQRK